MAPVAALAVVLAACSGGFRDPGGGANPEPADDSAPTAPGETGVTRDTAPTGDTAPPERAPLHPDRPGGWVRSTFVFGQARMVEDGVNDDQVTLGWLELDEEAEGTACGGSGPRVRRTFHKWADDENYPEGDCDQDRKDGVDFQRWDHAAVRVDDCPGLGAWAEADGSVATRTFLSDCPAHVTAGFGEEAHRATWEGWYGYDPAARTLTLRYEVNDTCKKEYYADLTHDAAGRLLAMRLDGSRTGDTSSTSRGLGATHGFAYGSSAGLAVVPSFDEGVAALRDREIRADAWRFREDRGDGASLEHYQEDKILGYTPVACRDDVAYHHSCVAADGHDPYLLECARESPPTTAYLRFLVDPFPDRASRKHLYWAWHAHHAGSWQGCYHRGSHANPLLQVVDASGAFRGYVGVEIQRSAETTGEGEVPEDAWRQTDYRVFRWVEAGFQELAAPADPTR